MNREVIPATPAGFDGLAAAVAGRRLRPGSMVALESAAPTQVQAFATLHAEAFGLVSAIEQTDRILRVADRRTSAGANDTIPGLPHARSTTDTIPGEPTASSAAEAIAGTGEGTALSTSLVLELAKQKLPYSPMEATLFYLGILDGSKGLPDPADIRALAHVLEAGAQRHVAEEFHGHLPRPRGKVRDLMTSPIQAVASGVPLFEAHGLLNRTGHGILPVMDAGVPLGYLTRSDIERAMRHGLGDRPVKEAMTPRVPTIDADAAAGAALDILLDGEPGCLVVVEAGKAIGMLARSDFLSHLYAPDRQPGLETREAGPLLDARWEPRHLERLRRISKVAGRIPVYLVGGAVRDLFLNRPSYDIDLMVEGDGPTFAKALAADLEAEISVHTPFGTATLTLANGDRIDVATARVEDYARPGALPSVSPAGLMQDLQRRDYSVNALAMRVDRAAWGHVVDLFGGLADLEAGHLRILHNLSFIEDPTRLVRGIRFERALGMRLEPVTEGFARYAMATGRLDGLGGERFKIELRKLFTVPGAATAALRLAELDAWRLLSPELAGRRVPVLALERLETLLEAWPEPHLDKAVDRFRTALSLVFAGVAISEVERSVASLHLAAEDAHAVVEARTLGERLLEDPDSWKNATPSLRFEALKPARTTTLLFLAASLGDSSTLEVIHIHLAQRKIKLEVDGHWLAAQGLEPGPLFGRILGDTLAAVLDGRIAGAEAQRSFALDRSRHWLAYTGPR